MTIVFATYNDVAIACSLIAFLVIFLFVDADIANGPTITSTTIRPRVGAIVEGRPISRRDDPNIILEP